MKSYYLNRAYIFILFLSIGCSRINTIEQFNKPPEIIFNDSITSAIIKDSIKISLKHSQKFYNISLQIGDQNKNLNSLSFELLSGKGDLYQNNQKLDGDRIEMNSENAYSLSYQPSEPGLHTLRFNATDAFGMKVKATLELNAFDNLPPLARFEMKIPDHPNDPLERIIDASGSYDQDWRFGGGITEYEYILLGKNIHTEKNTIPIIFINTGDYEISVRVLDNDNKWSEMKEERFGVE